jgi:hypothetical protein
MEIFMNTEQPTADVRDLGLAAALVSCGNEVLDTYKVIDGPTYFVFIQSKQLEVATNAYWADTLKVNARRYFDNLKMLKSRIYSE